MLQRLKWHFPITRFNQNQFRMLIMILISALFLYSVTYTLLTVNEVIFNHCFMLMILTNMGLYCLDSLKSINSFAVHGPTVWNSLPAELRSPDISLSVFRKQLKTYLFNCQ